MSAERPDFTPEDVLLEAGLLAERNRTDEERRADALDDIRQSLVAHVDFGIDADIRDGVVPDPGEGHIPGTDSLPAKTIYFRGDWPGPLDLDLLQNELFDQQAQRDAAFFRLVSERHSETGVTRMTLKVRELGKNGRPLKHSHLKGFKIIGAEADDPTKGAPNERLFNLGTTDLLRIARLIEPDRTVPISRSEFQYKSLGGSLPHLQRRR